MAVSRRLDAASAYDPLLLSTCYCDNDYVFFRHLHVLLLSLFL